VKVLLLSPKSFSAFGGHLLKGGQGHGRAARLDIHKILELPYIFRIRAVATFRHEDALASSFSAACKIVSQNKSFS